jgi:hypothetical protein
MKKDRFDFSPEALPPVLSPVERWQLERSIPPLPRSISQDEIRRVLRSQTQALRHYRAKNPRPRPSHARRNTVCVI